MNNQTYITKNFVKQNISACGRSAQSRIKMHNAKLYTKKNTYSGVLLKGRQKQLNVNARAGGEFYSAIFVS